MNQIASIQGCFKTEWSDGGVGNGGREKSVGAGEVRGDACLRCKGFQNKIKNADGKDDFSGAVFEAEKVRLSEKLWFHRSCFTCKACHGFLDVLRCTDNDGDEESSNIDETDIGNNDSPSTIQADHWSRWGGLLQVSTQQFILLIIQWNICRSVPHTKHLDLDPSTPREPNSRATYV